MNVDAALTVDARIMDIGAIIHNYRGEVKATLSKKIFGLFSPKVAETKSLGLSLVWARDSVSLNLQFVELDALTIVQALKNDFFFCHSEFSHLQFIVFLSKYFS